MKTRIRQRVSKERVRKTLHKSDSLVYNIIKGKRNKKFKIRHEMSK